MGWPNKIYCATKTLGVYYTSNFTDPTTQPTWSAANGGLPATDVRQFMLDPFTPATKQYLLLEATRGIYRRDNSGSWVSKLTSAACDAAVGTAGGLIDRIYTDKALAGRLWALFLGWAGGTSKVYAFYTDDYGDVWTAAAVVYSSAPNWVINTVEIQASGDNVFVSLSRQSGYLLRYSTNKGSSWSDAAATTQIYSSGLNPLQTDRVYLGVVGSIGNGAIRTCTNAGAVTELVTGLTFYRNDAIWFSPITPNHQRIVFDIDAIHKELFVTTDSWVTKNSPSAITPYPISIAPWAGTDEDQMFVGLVIDHAASENHALGCLYGEADVTAAGIAGANCGTSPYTDSIPYTCGGVAIGGVAAVFDVPTEGPIPPNDGTINPPGGTPVTLGGSANVQAVTMPGYAGVDRGEPLPGDRGAWLLDTVPHAELHASDIAAGIYIRHMPLPSIAGDVPMADGTKYVLTDVLTPTEHTAIGDGAPHHPAMTTAASLAVLMSITGQVGSLVVQNAKKALMGPVSGADASPTFRVLANTDLPSPLGFALAATPLTIAAGAVTVTQSLHTLTSQSGTSDDLDTITAAGDRTLSLLQATATHTITVKHGTGNISLNGAADFVLTGYITLLLFWNGTKWVDVGAGGAGGADANAIHVNVAGEIHALTNKALGVAADEIVIEESVGAVWTKKKVALSNLPYPAAAAHDHTTADGSGVLTNDEHDGYGNYIAIAKPASPAAGAVRLYAKAKKMYQVDEDGTETDLTAGGEGGSVATDVIWDAKGDLAVGTGANTAAKLTVGTDKQVHVADSASATGTKWGWPTAFPDRPPSSPSAYDDEFDSAVLNGKWTKTSTVVVEDINTTWPSHYYCQFNANGVLNLSQGYVPGASTGFAITAKFRAMLIRTYPQGSIAAYNSDEHEAVMAYYQSGGTTGILTGSLAYRTSNTWTYANQTSNFGHQSPFYVHLQRSAADDWGVWVSSDGYAWERVGTGIKNKVVTVHHFVINLQANSTNPSYMGIDWVRVNWITL